MNLYQFTIEVNDGVTVYEDKRMVMAPDDRTAARFARQVADSWQPNARLDSEHDIYSGPNGWPQWILSHCAALTSLNVPDAGRQSPIRVVLVPCADSLTDDMKRAADLVGSFADTSLGERSLRWLLLQHLRTSEHELSSVVRSLEEVRDALAGCTEAVNENSEKEIG